MFDNASPLAQLVELPASTGLYLTLLPPSTEKGTKLYFWKGKWGGSGAVEFKGSFRKLDVFRVAFSEHP